MVPLRVAHRRNLRCVRLKILVLELSRTLVYPSSHPSLKTGSDSAQSMLYRLRLHGLSITHKRQDGQPVVADALWWSSTSKLATR
jgi:hypothetical protein